MHEEWSEMQYDKDTSKREDNRCSNVSKEKIEAKKMKDGKT